MTDQGEIEGSSAVAVLVIASDEIIARPFIFEPLKGNEANLGATFGEFLAKANDKKPFLFACVRNAILEDSKVRRRDAPLDVEAIWFQPPDRDDAEEKNLRHALNALPGDQREVIVLHVWGELTFSDIGGLVGVSANTAASRYRYALAKLRRSMFREEDSSAQFG